MGGAACSAPGATTLYPHTKLYTHVRAGKYELVLEGIPDKLTWYTDRPARLAGQVTPRRFAQVCLQTRGSHLAAALALGHSVPCHSVGWLGLSPACDPASHRLPSPAPRLGSQPPGTRPSRRMYRLGAFPALDLLNRAHGAPCLPRLATSMPAHPTRCLAPLSHPHPLQSFNGIFGSNPPNVAV